MDEKGLDMSFPFSIHHQTRALFWHGNSLAIKQTYLPAGDVRISYERDAHLVGWQDAKEMNGGPLGRCQKFWIIAWLQECRHSRVDRSHQFIGFTREDDILGATRLSRI